MSRTSGGKIKQKDRALKTLCHHLTFTISSPALSRFSAVFLTLTLSICHMKEGNENDMHIKQAWRNANVHSRASSEINYIHYRLIYKLLFVVRGWQHSWHEFLGFFNSLCHISVQTKSNKSRLKSALHIHCVTVYLFSNYVKMFYRCIYILLINVFFYDYCFNVSSNKLRWFKKLELAYSRLHLVH